MSVAYSKFNRFFLRNPGTGTLVSFDEQNTATTHTPSGERIELASGNWDLSPLGGLMFAVEFTLSGQPADGSDVGLFNGGEKTAGATPERSIFYGRAGSVYSIQVNMGQGNGGTLVRFDLPGALSIGLHRLALRFPAAGPNAGVAYDPDQDAYKSGARLTIDGGAEFAGAGAGAMVVTDLGDDGVINRVDFNLGRYGAALNGLVHAAGWGHVGANGLVAGDAVEFSANGAAVGAPPVAPDAPTDIVPSAQTSTTMTLTVTAALTGSTPTGYELQHGVGGTWTSVARQASNVFNVTYAGVSGHDQWRALAYNGIGDSGWYAETIGFSNPGIGGGSLSSMAPVITSGPAASGVHAVAFAFSPAATGSTPIAWSTAYYIPFGVDLDPAPAPSSAFFFFL